MSFRTRLLLGGVILVLVFLFRGACSPAPPAEPAEPAQAANPLAGAWSVAAIETADGTTIDPAQPGLFIFTDGHYSAVYTNTSEARVPSATAFEPTDSEKLAQYSSLIVNTGNYSIAGSSITFRPLVAKSPGFIGGQATAEFDIAGDTLTLRYQSILSAGGDSASDVGGAMTLTRVE